MGNNAIKLPVIFERDNVWHSADGDYLGEYNTNRGEDYADDLERNHHIAKCINEHESLTEELRQANERLAVAEKSQGEWVAVCEKANPDESCYCFVTIRNESVSDEILASAWVCRLWWNSSEGFWAKAGQLHLIKGRYVPMTVKHFIEELKKERYDKKNIQIVSHDEYGDLHPIEKVELCLEKNQLHFCEYVIEARTQTYDPTTYIPDEDNDTFGKEDQK